jgi:hypothetical protein
MIYQFNSLFQSDFCFLYDESHKRPNMGVTGIENRYTQQKYNLS